MNWPGLKRRIRLQPNLIDPYRKISHREARRIWKEQGRPDVFELLEGARKKSGMTPEEWQALTGLKIRNTRATHSLALRRWAVACAFVLLFSAFLAFTAPGRAFAAKVYKTFTTIVENYIRISTDEVPGINVEPRTEIHESSLNSVNSVSEVYDQVNDTIFYLPRTKYTLKSITVTNSRARGQSVSSEYVMDQTSIYIVQRWPLDDQKNEVTIKMDDAIYHPTYGPNGLLFEGVYTEKENSYHGIAMESSYIIAIDIEHISSLEDIDDIVYDLLSFNG